MDAETLKYTPKFEPGSSEQQFVDFSATRFEQTRQQPNYLEQMVVTAEGLGEEYVKGAIGALDPAVYNREALTHHILEKDFGPLEKDPAQKNAHETAVAIVRQAEEVKRALLYQEVTANPEGLPPVERILLVGSLALSQLTDTIYFDEWRPQIRDCDLGRKLAKMEDYKPGSSQDVLPGDSLQTRWSVRGLIDPQAGIEKGNIKLIPYRESFATVPELIATLDKLTLLLAEEAGNGGEDYGYANFFRAWSACLNSDPEKQKETEDAMMMAWRQIDPEAPIFMIPWAEYDYFDPAGVAISPTFRFGVTDTREETQEIIRLEEIAKGAILRYVRGKQISGADSIAMSQSVHMTWTGFGGGDVLFAPSSQVLPNDPVLQLMKGCFIMPDLAQQAKGVVLRERYAQIAFPPEIEAQLRALKFTPLEQSVLEMHAHELSHPDGVTQKGQSRLAKLLNRFEEWKATLAGMHAQVNERDSTFARRALATLLYSSAAYTRLDGNYRFQGYANIARAVLTISNSLGILTYHDGEWQLNLDNERDIWSFWTQVENYVDWCVSVYKDAESAKDEEIEAVKTRLVEELRYKLGYGDRTKGEEEDQVGGIWKIKTELAFAALPKFTVRTSLKESVHIKRFNYNATEGLKVTLNERDFVLPLVQLGSAEDSEEIAYFDPSVDEELMEAGAQELAQQFLALGGECFVGVSSSKSEPMFRRAVAIVEEKLGRTVESMIVHRGPKSEFSGPEYEGREPIQIHSITGNKYIALGRSQDVTIGRWNAAGRRMVIGDDVISTGGTVNGLQDAITGAIGDHPTIPVAAVMEEVPLRVLPDGSLEWLGRVPLHHHPAIGTPVYKR